MCLILRNHEQKLRKDFSVGTSQMDKKYRKSKEVTGLSVEVLQTMSGAPKTNEISESYKDI